eukprot:gene1742-511_t
MSSKIKSTSVVLLGTEKSGKTTFYKQARANFSDYKFYHNEGTSKNVINSIREEILMTTLILIKEAQIKEYSTLKETKSVFDRLEGITREQIYKHTYFEGYPNGEKALAKDIKQVWNEKEVQQVFKYNQDKLFVDTIPYFMTHVTRIMRVDFTPTDEDYIKSYQLTAGVASSDINLNGIKIKLFDLGGQRSSRKKWDLTLKKEHPSVVYIISLGDYNLISPDTKKNRLKESLEILKNLKIPKEDQTESPMTSPRLFKKLHIILNKTDIFKKKIEEKINLDLCFEDYKDGLDYHKSLDFIKKKIEEILKEYHSNYQIMLTNCIDDKEMEKFFDQFTRSLQGKPLVDEKRGSNNKSPMNAIFKLFKSNSNSDNKKSGLFSPLIPASESEAQVNYSPRVKYSMKDASTESSNQIGKEWKVKKKLGQGGFGKIYLVEHTPTKKIYVMKRVKLDDMNDLNMALVEVKNLYELKKHKNINPIVDFFVQNAESNSDQMSYLLAIVTQFCDGGDLSTLIKQQKKCQELFTEKDIFFWINQMVEALSVIHTHKHQLQDKQEGYIHRDLKPENVFLSNDKQSIQIGDFGLTVLENQNKAIVGTPNYMSPEQYEGKEYDKKTDIWALGCIILDLLTLESQDYRSILLKQDEYLNEKFKELSKFYSHELLDIVRQCLELDPTQRPDTEKLQILLKNIDVNYVSSYGIQVNSWKTEDVLKWIEEIGYKEYSELFKKNDIDGIELLKLSENDLKEMGIDSIGHRRKIFEKISGFTL